MRTSRRSLAPRGHAVFELAVGLLLVFKPRDHHEPEHHHLYGQRLRVVRGSLVVTTPTRSMRLTVRSRPLTLAAGRRHSTKAEQDTWLLVEWTKRP